MFTQYFACCFRDITSVVPGDYDGDSQMDVLLTAKNGQKTEVFIFWGHNQTLGTAPNSDLFTNAALLSQEKGIPWTSRESLPGLTHRDRQPSMLAEMETQKLFLLSDNTLIFF